MPEQPPAVPPEQPFPVEIPPMPTHQPTLWSRFGRPVVETVIPGLRERREQREQEALDAWHTQQEQLAALAREHARIEAEQRAEERRQAFLEHIGATVAVVNVYGANELHFVGQDGEPVAPPARLPQRGRVTTAFNTLTTMFLDAGEGTHHVRGIHERTGLWIGKIRTDSALLAGMLPPHLLNFSADKERIRFGNISVAGRQATADEREGYRQRMDTETARRRAEHDAERLDLTQYDHARIHVGGRRFCIPMDTPNAIMAARVIEAIAEIGKPEMVTAEIVSTAWAAMTTTERGLFAKEHEVLHQSGSAITGPALEILRKVTNKMVMTREPKGERFVIDNPPAIEFNMEPPATGPGALPMIPIFPPGTDRERIHQFLGHEIPADSVERARVVMDTINNTFHMGHSDAVELLSFIMDQNGKRALRAELEERETGLTMLQVLHRLHTRVRLSLGEAYASAHRARCIAGDRIVRGHRITLVSGGLSPYITKWYIGRFDERDRPDRASRSGGRA
jgi:hypothetical protein